MFLQFLLLKHKHASSGRPGPPGTAGLPSSETPLDCPHARRRHFFAYGNSRSCCLMNTGCPFYKSVSFSKNITRNIVLCTEVFSDFHIVPPRHAKPLTAIDILACRDLKATRILQGQSRKGLRKVQAAPTRQKCLMQKVTAESFYSDVRFLHVSTN